MSHYFPRRMVLICVLGVLLLSLPPFLNAEVIRVMAANITSGNYQSYEAPGIRIFQGLQPDIVMIQEFSYQSGTLRDLVDAAFGTEYYYAIEPGGDNIPNGIVSRFPILSSGQWTDAEVPDRDFAWAVIDIPGDINLQAVSIHLKSGSGESGTRNAEALALKTLIQDNFDPDQYIVVGGDLNTSTRTEAAITTFGTFLDADDHTPADQNGNSNTSEPRTKPYDWVMPNHLLDERHTTLIIESSAYPEGLVFDSSVYTPLSEVNPVQYGDSHVTGMQHMAVMKAYETSLTSPTITPTYTPSRTPTPPPGTTPTPTSPQQPTATPAPPATPTPTSPPGEPTYTPIPTATPQELRITLELNGSTFHPGDEFNLSLAIQNDMEYHMLAQLVALDVYGTFFFAPSWGQDLDWVNIYLDPGDTRNSPILSFVWPEDTGSAGGLFFYAALTERDTFELASNLAVVTFGYSD